MFLDHSKLSIEDLTIIYTFLKTINTNAKIYERIKSNVMELIEKELFQICQTEPIQFGLPNIWVGKIGEQTISVGTDC
jgi:hypothetical protein